MGSVRTITLARRLALVPLAACLAAGCGAAPPVAIPSASPSPTASPTTIAPGVQVPASEVKVPPYSVSTTHPLPSGVSAATVAQDVVIDNLIENVAIERGDAALLSYADCGNWLAAESLAITQTKLKGETILSVTDAFSEVQVGFKADPSDPAVAAATILVGSETRKVRSAGDLVTTKTSAFSVIRWLAWSPAQKRFLTCDLGSG